MWRLARTAPASRRDPRRPGPSPPSAPTRSNPSAEELPQTLEDVRRAQDRDDGDGEGAVDDPVDVHGRLPRHVVTFDHVDACWLRLEAEACPRALRVRRAFAAAASATDTGHRDDRDPVAFIGLTEHLANVNAVTRPLHELFDLHGHVPSNSASRAFLSTFPIPERGNGSVLSSTRRGSLQSARRSARNARTDSTVSASAPGRSRTTAHTS